MMRQTKATLTTWGVTGVLTAGLFLFGCNRQTGDAQHGEHMHESTPHHESGAAKDAGTAHEHMHSDTYRVRLITNSSL